MVNQLNNNSLENPRDTRDARLSMVRDSRKPSDSLIVPDTNCLARAFLGQAPNSSGEYPKGAVPDEQYADFLEKCGKRLIEVMLNPRRWQLKAPPSSPD